MALFVAIIGALITLIGATGIAFPAALIRLVNAAIRSQRDIYLAAAFRLMLGLLLVFAAPDCRYPVVVWSLGILSILFAVALLCLGFARMRRFIDWWLLRSANFIRAWSLVAVAFGLFLIYAGT